MYMNKKQKHAAKTALVQIHWSNSNNEQCSTLILGDYYLLTIRILQPGGEDNIGAEGGFLPSSLHILLKISQLQY